MALLSGVRYATSAQAQRRAKRGGAPVTRAWPRLATTSLPARCRPPASVRYRSAPRSGIVSKKCSVEKRWHDGFAGPMTLLREGDNIICASLLLLDALVVLAAAVA